VRSSGFKCERRIAAAHGTFEQRCAAAEAFRVNLVDFGDGIIGQVRGIKQSAVDLDQSADIASYCQAFTGF